ncbi:MAG: RIP metalloprotease RseP [Gammaproteobacteria bacterium]
MSALIAIVAFLVAVAVLITFHEFGHFIMARLLGVKVLRFSLGFGRPLLRWQRGEGTEYMISALPFGGYVKLLDEREGPVPEPESGHAFNRQPIWARAVILVAGPAFNLLFAVLAYWVVFMAGIPGLKPVIGPVGPDTPAARAGLVERDTILAVNGKQTPTWEAAQLALLEAVVAERPLVLRVETPTGAERSSTLRYGDVKALTQPGALLSGLGISAWLPPLVPVIGKIEPQDSAARAGLLAGDHILAINDKKAADWDAVVKVVRAQPNRRLMFEIERNGRELTLPVIAGSRNENGTTVGYIGAAPKVPADYGADLRADYRLPPLAAFSAGVARTGQLTTVTSIMLYRMAVGQASLKNLSGPISIAQYAGAWAQAGIVPFLFFLAIISISLGILNALPIPLLDGGQLLFLGFELVRGRPLSANAEAVGQRVGLSLLAVLVGFALFSDLSRLFNS